MCKTLLRSVFLYPNGSIGMNNIILVGFMGTGKTTVDGSNSQLSSDCRFSIWITSSKPPKKSPSLKFLKTMEKRISEISNGSSSSNWLQPMETSSLPEAVLYSTPISLILLNTASSSACTATPQTILQQVRDDQNRPLLAGEKKSKFKRC